MCLGRDFFSLSCLGSVELLESADQSFATFAKFSVMFSAVFPAMPTLLSFLHSDETVRLFLLSQRS